MKKEQKEEIKKIISTIDDNKLLRFAKSYAAKNEDFAKAIIEHFMPADKPIDYETEIAGCFAHKKKGRVSSLMPHLDWAAIRKDSKRVMKQLQFLADAEDYAAVADAALLFLDTLCKAFNDDDLGYEYSWYEGKDFSNLTAEKMLRKVLTSENTGLSKSERIRLMERLKAINAKGVIDQYLYGDIESLIDEAQASLLDNDQLLEEIDMKIAAAKYDHEKGLLIIRKVQMLKDMNRAEKAEQEVLCHLDNNEVRKFYLDILIGKRQFDKALQLCKSYLAEKASFPQVWMEYQLKIGEGAGLKNEQIEALSWLALNANAYLETRQEYCSKLKKACDEQTWVKIREVFVKELIEKHRDKRLGFWLLVQEKQVDRLYKYSSALSSAGYFQATVEMLEYYVPFADLFSEEQQEEMEKRICTQILNYGKAANKDKQYNSVAYALEQLSRVRSAASAKARSVRDELILLNPRKPLFLATLREADL